jgi:hypothetical protein
MRLDRIAFGDAPFVESEFASDVSRCTLERFEGRHGKLKRGVAALNDRRLHLPGAIPTERGRPTVFIGLEAGDALLERRKFYDDETMKARVSLHDFVLAAARKDSPAIFGDDGWHKIGVSLVLILI